MNATKLHDNKKRKKNKQSAVIMEVTTHMYT